MSALAKASLILGSAVIVAHLPCLAAPAGVKAWLRRFPRNVWAGRILTAADFVWVFCLLVHTPLGRFENLRMVLYLLVPVSCALVALFMDELLAPRALGGLLLLASAPLLSVARWHTSAWRYTLVIAAYVLVVEGIALVLSPYLFRRAAERLAGTDRRCRGWGAGSVAFGILLVTLALTAY